MFDGSFHTVDSNEQSFKMAGILAFKTVAPKCKPVLLEPLAEIDVVTPDEYMGDVLGDLSSRRGHILGTEVIDSGTASGGTRVRAIVPEAELHTYAGTLQSMTQGRATFTKRFVGPPGFAHGGISAMLADQIVACTPGAIGVKSVTKSLELEYLRPLPLGEEVELWGVCVPVGVDFEARFTITARGKVAVRGTAVLVAFEHFVSRSRPE